MSMIKNYFAPLVTIIFDSMSINEFEDDEM